MNVFDYVNSIINGREYISDLSAYDAFITNKALSLHVDILFDANTMNIHSNIDKDMQYDFYMKTVTKRKRPIKKWPKPEKNEDIQLVQDYYKYSRSKAKDALRILSDDDLETIKTKMSKGGVKK